MCNILKWRNGFKLNFSDLSTWHHFVHILIMGLAKFALKKRTKYKCSLPATNALKKTIAYSFIYGK
jgi:hypothetical protein